MQQPQYEQVVACIKKPPLQRTSEEARVLVPWLMKKSQLFNTLKTEDGRGGVSKEVVMDILKNCEYAEKKRDAVIIRQGDKGDRFYIILSGRVSIFINTEAVPDDPAEATVLVQDEVVDEKPGEKKRALDRSLYGNNVASIDAGKSFGELALINKDCIRNASVIADELTHLLVVDRDLYNRSLRAFQEAEFQQRIDFVNRSSLFSNWQLRFKRQAAMSLRKESLIFEMPVIKQGEPINGLVFILKGQAKVVVDLTMHYHQYPQLNLHEDPEEQGRKEIYGEMMEQGSEGRHEGGQRKLWNKPLRRQGYVVAESRQAQRHLETSLIGPDEVLGDIEQALDLPTYMQSVICTQPCDIYVLDTRNYERLVSHKRNPGTLALLRKKAELKVISRMARPLDRQIPLIRHLAHRILEAHRSHAAAHSRSGSPNGLASLIAEAGLGGSADSFIPQRGPLIDHYGPGTVFYRNKMKRLAKIRQQRAKEHTKLEAKGGGRRLVGAMFNIQQGDHNGHSSDSSSDDDEAELRSRRAKSQAGDWETSDEHLVDLEERINFWLTEAASKAGGQKPANMPPAKLARFKKEEQQKIFPGKTVYLRPRQKAHREPKAGEESHADSVFITETKARANLGSARNGAARRPNFPTSSINGEEPAPIDAKPPNPSPAPPVHGSRVQGAEAAAASKAERAERAAVRGADQLTPRPRSEPAEGRSASPQRDEAPARTAEDEASRLQALHRLSAALPASAFEDPVGSAMATRGAAELFKAMFNHRIAPRDIQQAMCCRLTARESATQAEEGARRGVRPPERVRLRARTKLLPRRDAPDSCPHCHRPHALLRAPPEM